MLIASHGVETFLLSRHIHMRPLNAWSMVHAKRVTRPLRISIRGRLVNSFPMLRCQTRIRMILMPPTKIVGLRTPSWTVPIYRHALGYQYVLVQTVAIRLKTAAGSGGGRECLFSRGLAPRTTNLYMSLVCNVLFITSIPYSVLQVTG
jgi:hypothetical protein